MVRRCEEIAARCVSRRFRCGFGKISSQKRLKLRLQMMYNTATAPASPGHIDWGRQRENILERGEALRTNGIGWTLRPA